MRIVLLVLALLAGSLAALEGGVLPCDVAPVQPSCSVALRPGPVTDVLSILDVPDELSSSSSGELLLTTVSVQRDLDLDDLVEIARDPAIERADRELYFPPDVDPEVTEQAFRAMMLESELTATVAALTELGYDVPPDGARIESVIDDGPSDGVVEAGEVVVAVDGTAVVTSEEFADEVGGRDPGTTVELTVRTIDDQQQRRTLELGTNPDDASRGFAGLFVSTSVDVPVEVEFEVEGIGGPSAGLMFALTIVDLLSEEDLTGALVVAGTGEIGLDGRVGPIGGIRQKLPGAVERPGAEDDAAPATVFLLPRGNVEEARLAVPGAELLLVPVDTLGDAVDALAVLRDGGTPQDSFTLPAQGLSSGDAG